MFSTAFLPLSSRRIWTLVDKFSTEMIEINDLMCLQASTDVYDYALSRR